MIYLHGYHEVKMLNEERQSRARARLVAKGRLVPDSYHRPHPPVEAEIVEVLFGTHCDQIGA